MTPHELQDPKQARLFLLHGLWLQRVLPPTAATVRPVLELALELAANGQPLPPPGFVADVAHLALGEDRQDRARKQEEPFALPGLPPTLMRSYEDHVLGKLCTDWTFARAGDAVRHYVPGGEERQRERGLAFLINQFRARAGFAGVELGPTAIKALREMPPEQVLAEGWQSLDREGLMPLLVQLYEALIAAARLTTEVLAPEDVFELEHKTALAEFGQRIALRQVLQAAGALEANLPRYRLRSQSRAQEVPTHLLDEDTYPVGGFASIATRGSIESLLHSQLAYMEKEERPDLFDIKFLRDELLYYSRDENQFLRRRRTFAFVLYPDLVHARFKDAGLPYQRGVLALGLLLAGVRRASEWLSTDALRFEFLFLGTDKADPLEPEREVVAMVLREQLANGTVRLRRLPSAEAAAKRCTQWARRSTCQGLLISTARQELPAEDVEITGLLLDGPVPLLYGLDEESARPEMDDPLAGWSAVLQQLLQRWV